MAYDADYPDLKARRPLRGQDFEGRQPSDLPVRQPTKLTLVIDLRPPERSWRKSASKGGFAAILSADVVGYSRLIGIDETGTLSRLNALRRELIDPAIAAHSGRIVKLMGDGALVEFASVRERGKHARSRYRDSFGSATPVARSRSDPVPDWDQRRRHHHRGRGHPWRRRQHRRRGSRASPSPAASALSDAAWRSGAR